jgi:hypothetical protein
MNDASIPTTAQDICSGHRSSARPASSWAAQLRRIGSRRIFLIPGISWPERISFACPFCRSAVQPIFGLRWDLETALANILTSTRPVDASSRQSIRDTHFETLLIDPSIRSRQQNPRFVQANAKRTITEVPGQYRLSSIKASKLALSSSRTSCTSWPSPNRRV